jgi:hypothetical protein
MGRKILLLIILLFALSSSAQYHNLGYGFGPSQLRGDITETGKLIDDLGLNLYVYYSYWLAEDERWQLSALLDLDYLNGKIIGANDGGFLFDAHSFLLSPMVGIRYYADEYLLDYVPEKYQDAYFAGIYFGPAIAFSDYTTPVQLNSTKYSEIPSISFAGKLLIGYRIYWNSHWALEVSGSAKYGANDRWDGYKGSTGVNDFLFQLSAGVSYSFYKPQ